MYPLCLFSWRCSWQKVLVSPHLMFLCAQMSHFWQFWPTLMFSPLWLKVTSSYLVNLVYEFFHFSLIPSSNDGFCSLGTLQNCGICFSTQLAFLVLLLVGFSCFDVPGWGFSMLFIRNLAVPCPADLHCFSGTDYDELMDTSVSHQEQGASNCLWTFRVPVSITPGVEKS